MGDLSRDSIDFGNGRISATFARILVPTLLGMMFSVLFCLTDGIFIGQGIGSDGLASVNLVMPIFTLATGIGMMFAMGASVVAAIHMSQDNLKAARIVVTQAFLAALFFGTILGVILYAFPDRMLVLMGCSDSLMSMCREYYLWFIPCALFVMLQILGQFIIRLDGSPKYSMMVEIVPACVNIFLDWLFIFPMGWGLMGAALATSIGSFLGVLMVAWYMLSGRKTLALYRLKTSLTSFLLTMRNIWYMMKIGVSGFLGEFSMSVLTLVGNYVFMRMLGEDGVAAFSVACYLIPVVFMVYAAISQSAQPIISYNYGAGAFDRVRRTLRLALVIACVFGVSMSLLMTVFVQPIVSVFLERGSNAFELCVSGFPIYSCGFLFMALAMTVIGFAQSVEKSAIATVLTVLRGMALPTVAFLVLPRIFGETGLWAAVPVAELLTALAICLFALCGLFRLKGTVAE